MVEAFERKMYEMKPEIVRWVRSKGFHNDAEDIYQSVWVRLLPYAKKYKWDLEGSSGVIFKTARNLVRDLARKRRREQLISNEDFPLELKSRETAPETTSEQNECRASVVESLRLLTMRQRDAVITRFYRCNASPLRSTEHGRLRKAIRQLRMPLKKFSKN